MYQLLNFAAVASTVFETFWCIYDLRVETTWYCPVDEVWSFHVVAPTLWNSLPTTCAPLPLAVDIMILMLRSLCSHISVQWNSSHNGRGGSRGKYWGQCPPPEIEATKAPSGERQRRENQGAKRAE